MKSFLKTVFLMGLIVSIHLSPPCNAAQQFSPPPDFGGGMPQMAMPNQEEMEQAMKELEKNPQMMEELGREMEKLMQDPAFLDTMDQIMSDPEAMKQIEAQAKEFEKAFQKQEDNQKEKESGTDKPLEKKDAKLVGPKDVTIVSTTGDLKRDFLEPTPEAKQEDEKIQLPQDKWDAFHYYIGAIISSLNRIMGKINSFALGIEAQDKLQFLEKDITKLKISFGILSSKKLYQRHLFTSKNTPLREAIAKQAEALQEIEQTIPALHGETEDEEKLAKVLTPDSTEEDIDAYLMESSLKKHSEQPLKTLSFTARENIIKQLTTISNVKLKDIMEKTESVVTSPEVRQEVEKKKQEIWQRIEEQRKKLKNTRISSKDWMPGYSGGGRDSNYSPIHPSRRGGRNGGYQDYGDDYEDWQDIPEDNSPTTGTSDNAPYWGGDKKADDAETIPLNELIQSLLENDNIKTIIKIGKSDFWFQPEAEYFPGITLAITSINFARLTEDIIAAEQRLYRKKIKDKLDKKAGKKAKKKAADNVDARVIAKYEQLLKNLVPGIVKMYYHCETNFMPLILEGGNTKILRTIPWREESTDTLKLIKNIFESKQQFNEKGLAAFNKKLVETIQKTLEDNQKKITQLQKFAETVEQQLGGSKNSTDKFTAETFNTKLQAFENARFQSVFAIIKNGIAKLDPKFASVIKELEQISQINNKESGEERRKAALKTVVEKHQRTVYKNVLATCQAFTNIGFDIRLLYPTKITNKVHFTAEKGSKAFIDYYLQEAEKKLRQLHGEELNNLLKSLTENVEKLATKRVEEKQSKDEGVGGWILRKAKNALGTVAGIPGAAINKITNLVTGGDEGIEPLPQVQAQLADAIERARLIWSMPAQEPTKGTEQQAADQKQAAQIPVWQRIKDTAKLIGGSAAVAAVGLWTSTEAVRTTVWKWLPEKFQNWIKNAAGEETKKFITGKKSGGD